MASQVNANIASFFNDPAASDAITLRAQQIAAPVVSGQAITVDAIVPRLCPGLVEITEGSLFLLVIGQWVVGGCEGRWMAHGTQQMCARVQGGARRIGEV